MSQFCKVMFVALITSVLSSLSASAQELSVDILTGIYTSPDWGVVVINGKSGHYGLESANYGTNKQSTKYTHTYNEKEGALTLRSEVSKEWTFAGNFDESSAVAPYKLRHGTMFLKVDGKTKEGFAKAIILHWSATDDDRGSKEGDSTWTRFDNNK